MLSSDLRVTCCTLCKCCFAKAGVSTLHAPVCTCRAGALHLVLCVPQGVIKLGEQRAESKCTLVYGQMNEPPGARARVALTGATGRGGIVIALMPTGASNHC